MLWLPSIYIFMWTIPLSLYRNNLCLLGDKPLLDKTKPSDSKLQQTEKRNNVQQTKMPQSISLLTYKQQGGPVKWLTHLFAEPSHSDYHCFPLHQASRTEEVKPSSHPNTVFNRWLGDQTILFFHFRKLRCKRDGIGSSLAEVKVKSTKTVPSFRSELARIKQKFPVLQTLTIAQIMQPNEKT